MITYALYAMAAILLAAVIASSPAAVAPEHLPSLLLAMTAPVGFGLSISILVFKLSVIPPLARCPLPGASSWEPLARRRGRRPVDQSAGGAVSKSGRR